MTVAPSDNPMKVPVTASAASLLPMTNVFPLTGVNPVVMASAPANVIVPVTFNWSYCVPALVPFRSALNVPAAVCV